MAGRAVTVSLSTQIELDTQGVAWVAGTNVKVIEVVLDKAAYGWSPEELHFQHPGLSLAQIHGALTYYYEHQAELDADIERRMHDASQLAARLSDPEFRSKLASLKRPR
jgi:uncharacterized protein (DUF433 family)